jgi:hypothetical protein
VDLEWTISDTDVESIRMLLDSRASCPLVIRRHRVNLADLKPPVDKAAFWREMTSARLTSVQRSGPRSHVARFLRTDPFPLAYQIVAEQADPAPFIADALRASGGIRFAATISTDLSTNLRRLESGEWSEALRECNRLTTAVSADVERQVADYIRSFKGFGPKQSRNLLQGLGLTRYEIPIDSRITAWLNDFGFPVHLSAAALADPSYYNFVSRGIQALCTRSDVYPCVLDAAIFGSSDGDGWAEGDFIA